MTHSHVIGRWHFDPREPMLRGAGGERRLEERAARTLELLCSRRGDVVSKDELIAAVWQGRSVSPNSVAIVIGSLRRALDDDPQTPDHIVTVNKRGYRLTKPDPATPPIEAAGARPKRRQTWAWLATAILALALLSIGVAALRPPSRIELLVEPVRNDTGRVALDGLAHSLRPVVVDSAVRLRGVRVFDTAQPARSGDRRIVLRPRLILWNGAPELAVTAIDLRSGRVIWSEFAAGPPAMLARNAARRIATLQPRLNHRAWIDSFFTVS